MEFSIDILWVLNKQSNKFLCWPSIMKLFETILYFIDDGLCPLANDTEATNEVAEEAVCVKKVQIIIVKIIHTTYRSF